MKFSLEGPSSGHIVRAYGKGHFTIDDVTLHCSVLITGQEVVSDWLPTRFEDLHAHHFDRIAEMQPELVVLGTGALQRFPDVVVLEPLLRRNIGVEVMDTGAACRTYNVLTSEGRAVIAALLVITDG